MIIAQFLLLTKIYRRERLQGLDCVLPVQVLECLVSTREIPAVDGPCSLIWDILLCNYEPCIDQKIGSNEYPIKVEE